MDAIQFLKQEHEKAKAAFAKVLKAAPETRGELWTTLQPELEVHEQIEDTCVYAPLSRQTDSKLADWRKTHRSEVKQVEGLIKEVDKLDPEDASWLSKLKLCTRASKAISRKRSKIFSLGSARSGDDKRLQQAGTELKEMKTKKLKLQTVR